MQVHFLKIIWGDVTVLKDGDRVALIDTGYDTTFESIKQYLDELGVREISFILLTHFHRDHYGSIPQLLEAYKVGKVYFKEYAGVEPRTAWGTPADDEYRNSEREKWQAMRELIEEKSELAFAEKTESIPFGSYELKLYSTANRVKTVYEDESCEATYRKFKYGENSNSLAAYMKVGKANLYFGGDISDSVSEHPLCHRRNTEVAKEIGEEMDLYKVPHHGTGGCNSEAALEIYKPKIAVITNRIGFLSEKSPIFADLKKANPDVRILLTERSPVVVDVAEDGTLTVEKCDGLVI